MPITGWNLSSVRRMKELKFRPPKNFFFNMGTFKSESLERKRIGLYGNVFFLNPKKQLGKKQALSKLAENRISCIYVVTREDARDALDNGSRLFAKPQNKKINNINEFEDAEYYTRWIKKKEEYRVIVMNKYINNYIDRKHRVLGELELDDTVIVKVYRKLLKSEFADDVTRKIEHCAFKDVTDSCDEELKELAIKATECVGYGFAGVDILKNMKGVYKVIEVNSAPGLGENTINKIKEITGW